MIEKLYRNGVLLGDDSPDGWGICYAREFDMTNDSKLFPPRTEWEGLGYRPNEYGFWVSANGGVALPLYEGRMIDQFDFSYQGWVSGKGRTTKWQEQPWDAKHVQPQFLMSLEVAGAAKRYPGLKVAHMRIGASTNARSAIATPLAWAPTGDTASIFWSRSFLGDLNLTAVLNSFAFDWIMRMRLGGVHLDYHVFSQNPLVERVHADDRRLALAVAALSLPFVGWATIWLSLRREAGPLLQPWKHLWAVTRAERVRVRSMIDVVVALLYDLSADDFAWILRACDHPVADVTSKPFSRTLDPKSFWRVDKELDPELRHTVLAQVAFQDLQRMGLDAFLAQNDGEGWMLPETLRLADYGLGHDDRAKQPQPVRARLGERFLPWQLAQSVEESWAECARHAEAIEKLVPSLPAPAATESKRADGDVADARARPTDLLGEPLPTDLFGNVIAPHPTRRRRS